ncbi:MAG TPA: hypothetical protein VJZ27_10190, partial [Aggregatilineales bacterium]|nr:hypothetical protein [Aggregatilineales bacterium]
RTIFRPLVDTYLSKECLTRTGFKADVVQQMVNGHLNRRGYYLHQLWNLLVFQLWYAIYIDESLKLPERWSAQELVERTKIH